MRDKILPTYERQATPKPFYFTQEHFGLWDATSAASLVLALARSNPGLLIPSGLCWWAALLAIFADFINYLLSDFIIQSRDGRHPMKIAIRFVIIVASMMKLQDILVQWYGNILQKPLSVYEWIVSSASSVSGSISPSSSNTLWAPFRSITAEPSLQHGVRPLLRRRRRIGGSMQSFKDAFGTLFAFGLASSAARGIILNVLPYLMFSSGQLLSDQKMAAWGALGLTWFGSAILCCVFFLYGPTCSCLGEPDWDRG